MGRTEVVGAELDARRFRRWRVRRQTAEIQRPAGRQLSRDAEDIIDFARVWAAFGGVPADETFVRFGMSRTRFVDQLWQVIREFGCDGDLAHRFRETFPPPSLRDQDRIPPV